MKNGHNSIKKDTKKNSFRERKRQIETIETEADRDRQRDGRTDEQID